MAAERPSTIARLQVRNFKGFRHLDAPLREFNVLVGPNASGKSSVVEALRFVRDVAFQGLDNAVSLQGGVKYLRNLKLGDSEEFKLALEVDSPGRSFVLLGHSEHRRAVHADAARFTHRLSLRFKKGERGFEVSEDSVLTELRFYHAGRHANGGSGQVASERKELGTGSVKFEAVRGELKREVNLPKGLNLHKADLVPEYLQRIEVPRARSVAFGPSTFLFFLSLAMAHPQQWPADLATSLGIYDFDPKLPRRAAPITARAELEENGSNLALVLKSVLRDKSRKRTLTNLASDLLDFVRSLAVESVADKSLLLKVKENFFKEMLPASSLSDGTINIIALLVALYFEAKSVVVIEEPERSIHPKLIERVVSMMKEAAKQRQVIVTTQSAELVRHCEVEDLLFVSRDKEGFCQVTRPAASQQVRAFLEGGLELADLHEVGVLGP